MVVKESNQNVSPQGEKGSFIGGASSAPSSAIGRTYMRGPRYSYEGRVLLTRKKFYVPTDLKINNVPV